jgi:hypothetical protein
VKDFKGTPGKWEINDIEDGTAEIVVWDYDAKGEVEGSTIVVPVLYMDDETAEADASMLAASPKLFEALNDFLNHFEGNIPLWLFEKAEAAVSEALGETK